MRMWCIRSRLKALTPTLPLRMDTSTPDVLSGVPQWRPQRQSAVSNTAQWLGLLAAAIKGTFDESNNEPRNQQTSDHSFWSLRLFHVYNKKKVNLLIFHPQCGQEIVLTPTSYKSASRSAVLIRSSSNSFYLKKVRLL